MEKTQIFFMLDRVVLIAPMVCFSPPNSVTCKTSDTGNMKFRTVVLIKQLKILRCLRLPNAV